MKTKKRKGHEDSHNNIYYVEENFECSEVLYTYAYVH